MFYVLAALIVAAAVAAVALPAPLHVLLAVMAVDVLVGVLLIDAGAWQIGAVAVLGPTLALLVVGLLLQRSGHGALLEEAPGWAAAWPAGAAAAAALAVLLAWATASSVADGARGGGTRPQLVTVLHYRTPIALGVAVVLALVAIAGGLLIGRLGEDERALDRAVEERRRREQHAELRRQQRLAARERRSRSGDAGS